MIPYGRQNISDEDIDAVIEVLKSDFITQGPIVPLFEEKISKYCSSKYALAMNSATSALHIACLALDVGPGDYVWTSAVSFVATANCALYCGAKIDFIDIDEDFYNLSIEKLENKLQKSKKTNTLPKVLIVVHLTGQPIDMERIHLLSKEYGFRVIEDASHAIGAKYKKELIGNCKYSDCVVFSFHPVKIITTGEGGMLLTNNSVVFDKANKLRTHGITKKNDDFVNQSHGPWYYEQNELGFNYRMTDIQAALGISQLNRIDNFIKRRKELAKSYNSSLKDFPVIIPKQHVTTESSWHLYVIRLDLVKIKKTHKEIFEFLRSSGIGVQIHYIPIILHPYYERLKFNKNEFPNSMKYYKEAISLPIYASLSDEEQREVVKVLKKALNS